MNLPNVMRQAAVWLAALLFAAAPFVAHADDELPGRVARIAEFAGQLYLSPQESPTVWESIGINYPITSGANLWVSGDGRAEVAECAPKSGGPHRMTETHGRARVRHQGHAKHPYRGPAINLRPPPRAPPRRQARSSGFPSRSSVRSTLMSTANPFLSGSRSFSG